MPQLLTKQGSELVPQGVQAGAGSRQQSKLKRPDGSKLTLSIDELIASRSMRRGDFGIGYHSSGTKHRLLGGDQLLQWGAAIVSPSESDEELSAAAAAQAEDSEGGWRSFDNMVASRVRSGRGMAEASQQWSRIQKVMKSLEKKMSGRPMNVLRRQRDAG